MGDSDDEVSEQLERLAALLRDPVKRRSFYLNPDQTMADEGVVAGVIPQGFVDTLKELSHAELGLVSRAQTSLRGRLNDAELRLIVMFPV